MNPYFNSGYGPGYTPGYNPSYSAFPAQQRLAALEQQRMAPSMVPMGNGLKGRMVMGLEEARAAQIDFDGSVSYFPSPAEGKIYTKSTDLNGMPVFMTYALQETPQPAQVDGSALVDIRNRLNAVEKCLEDLGYVKPNAAGSDAPAK